jgi:anti-anti-sigma regulatory factor
MEFEIVDGAAALPSLLDLTAAEPLHRALLAWPAGTPLILHGGAVEQVSTPCLQVLLAAALAARAQDRRFELRDSSGALRSAIEDLGLTQAMTGETTCPSA